MRWCLPIIGYAAGLALLVACGADPNQATLAENVGAAFAPCNESEIKFLAEKHNFMLSFRACANNNFERYAWSPDGRLLYFQLVMTGYVMDAEAPAKNTTAVPVPTPIGPATWLNSTRLVVPVGPAADAPAGAPYRLAFYEARQGLTFYVDLPAGLGDIDELHRGARDGEVLALATWNGRRTVWSIDTADGSARPAWAWLPDGATSFTFTPRHEVASVGFDDEVKVYDATNGVRVATFAPARRGSLHPDGVWMMLEREGDPVSIFYQRHWDELSEQARERELRRAQRFEEGLPEHFPREVRPPTLSFANVVTGQRWELDSVYGHDFSWYEPTPYYGAFVLWGFEGKQYKRNVMLGDFGPRMIWVSEKDREFLGVKPMAGRFEGPDGGGAAQPSDPASVDPAAVDPAPVEQAPPPAPSAEAGG